MRYSVRVSESVCNHFHESGVFKTFIDGAHLVLLKVSTIFISGTVVNKVMVGLRSSKYKKQIRGALYIVSRMNVLICINVLVCINMLVCILK